MSYFYECPACSFERKTGKFRDELKGLLAQRVEGKCPYCRSEIETGTAKCKHCGEWLYPAQRQLMDSALKAQITTGRVANFIAIFLVISIAGEVLLLIIR